MPTNNSWDSQDPVNVEKGGTGRSTLGIHGVIVGNSPVTVTSAGTSGQVLQSGGALADPSYLVFFPSTTNQGDLLISDSANSFISLSKDTNISRVLSNTGVNNAPKWDLVNLANGVTGALPIANSGTAQTSKPSFAAYKSAATNNVTGNGTVYHFICDTEDFDIGNNYNSGTGTFTAPITGTYFFEAKAYLKGTTNINFIQVGLITTSKTFRSTLPVISGSDKCLEITQLCYLNSGDTCYPTVAGYGEASDSDDLEGNNIRFTTFSGYYIGP